MIRRIGVAALGDPRDRRTWSGTAANVITSLERLGVEVAAIDGRESGRLTRYALFGLHQLRRPWLNSGVREHVTILSGAARSDYNWSPAARRQRSQRVAAAAERQQVSSLLHLGIGTLPLPDDWSREGQLTHYLLCDSTWRELSSCIVSPGRISQDQIRRIDAAEAAMFRQAKHIFVIGEHVRESLELHYGISPSRITCVGSGFNIPAYRGVKNYQEGHILFTAKVRWHDKGGDLLIDGFRLARHKLPNARLVVVGQEHYVKALKREPGVCALGFVDHRQLQELFAQAAIFAMPALCEPWGLVYLEALASRTPILGLNRFAFSEISQNDRFGFSVHEPTPQAVADTIVRALNDPAALEVMGWSGQTYVLNRYSWDKVAQKIAHVLGQRP